jgi:hypothetical protein
MHNGVMKKRVGQRRGFLDIEVKQKKELSCGGFFKPSVCLHHTP